MSEWEKRDGRKAAVRGACPWCGNDTYSTAWGQVKECQRCGRRFTMPPKKIPAPLFPEARK